ncbi:uncharacterized protein M6B38_147080 [Iris pallida]|uniref:Uncharacterized protein n=1 Tax=Iris pallida TaxID=29817 RepID=A0AAX6F9T9_IRIPA|nr:uncharacterized protein M6B38_147080 [Iris pallida]
MVWSAENATRAYLCTLKSRNKGTEPDVAEFVSALAAGSGARLMVEACSGTAGPTTLALAAAAQQTEGARVVCVVPKPGSAAAFEASNSVEIVVGDAAGLLADRYKGADFVLVDCELEGQERLFNAAVASVEGCGGVVVGYNAFSCDSSSWGGVGGVRVDLLPIGGGLRVCRVPARSARTSQWVVRVDECTGEEHVYRITSPRTRSAAA